MIKINLGVLLLSSLIFSGCSCTTPKVSKTKSLVKGMSSDDQQKLEEYRAEIEIGRNMAGRLLSFYGVADDDELDAYVNQVGSYVAGFSDHPERRYMFQVLNSDIVNAFAAPGGYILVTRGAIKHAQNEAELAFVLAHEVAHVGHKHMFDSLKGMSKEDIDKAVAKADKAAMERSPELKARARPKPQENEVGATLAKYMSGASAGMSILSAAKAGMSLILEEGLGADKEFEADSYGTRYAVRAGYHQKAGMNYLCRLQQKKASKNKPCKIRKVKKKKGKKSILDKTHPSVVDRVGHIRKTLKDMDALDGIGAKGEVRFRQIKKLVRGKAVK